MAGDTAVSIGELADRYAIQEQLYTYCRAVDRLDIPLGRSVFHEDSHADYGAHYYQGPGRDVIDRICAEHLLLDSHSHQITNILIRLDGDRAGSEAYVTATIRLRRDGAELQICIRGRYLDAWEKRAGRWRIARRVLAMDHDEIREVAPVQPPFHSTRDGSDPSYRLLPAEG